MPRKILKPKDFPALLKQIPDQPELLYMEGELPPDDAIYLAVVGARKFTTYGKEACEKIIGEDIPVVLSRQIRRYQSSAIFCRFYH